MRKLVLPFHLIISLLKTNFVGMHLRSEFGGLQERHSIFGGENDVHQNKGERFGHRQLHHIYMLLSRSFLRPFAARRREGRFPGLKPRAESCSPFGAKTVPTSPSLCPATGNYPFGLYPLFKIANKYLPASNRNSKPSDSGRTEGF